MFVPTWVIAVGILVFVGLIVWLDGRVKHLEMQLVAIREKSKPTGHDDQSDLDELKESLRRKRAQQSAHGAGSKI